jgi:hypothetical protein
MRPRIGAIRSLFVGVSGLVLGGTNAASCRDIMQPSADDETFVLRIHQMIEDVLRESRATSARASSTDLFVFVPRRALESAPDTWVD